MTSVGKYIRQRRRELDITQKSFGEMLGQYGESRKTSAISDWEREKKEVPVKLYVPISRVLNISPFVLFEISGAFEGVSMEEFFEFLARRGVSPDVIKEIADQIRSEREKPVK